MRMWRRDFGRLLSGQRDNDQCHFEPLFGGAICNLWVACFSKTRSDIFRSNMKIAFQGEPGAYSEQAVFNYFGQIDTYPHESFDAVFDAVVTGACQSALIPIENSLAGSIHQNYDLLLRHDLHIVGEYLLRVQHCLIVLPDVKKSDIKKVISHPQALGQCAAYLRALGVKTEQVYDTAGSVKMLKVSGARDTAAIASRRAA